jgi:hypothetical protein
MKRIIGYLLVITLLLSLLAVPAIAASDLKISVGEKQMEYKYGQPVIINERTLVPLRDLLLNLGVVDDNEHIQWNGKLKTVTVKYGDITLLLTLNSKEIIKNGNLFQEVDVPATLIDNRLYLPARAVAEALGYTVTYNQASNSIDIIPSQTTVINNTDTDTTPPRVTAALATSSTSLEVTFSEKIDPLTAKTPSYYLIKNKDGTQVEIKNVVLQADQSKATLTTEPLYGVDLSLEVVRITDLNGNIIVTERTIFAGVERPVPIITDLKVVTVEALTSQSIQVTFDHQLDQQTAETISIYSVGERYGTQLPLVITKAELQSDTTKVILTTSAQKAATLYSFSVDASVVTNDDPLTFLGIGGPSTPAQANPIPDGETGNILSVVAVGITSVEVTFDFELDQNSAETITNYTIQQVYGQKSQLPISHAVLQSDKTKVILTTNAQSPATYYKLIASNIKDSSGHNSTLESVNFQNWVDPNRHITQ